MRRRVVEYPQGGMFRGRELPRLMTMLCFLVILGMMMYRSSDPNTWKWLAPAEAERTTAIKDAKAEKEPSKPEPIPVATGPTDLDPDEAQTMAANRQAISDRTLYIQREEMFAYNQVLHWVHNQPWAVLEKRAKKGLLYDQLVSEPEKCRLTIVEWDLEVRLIRAGPDMTGPGGEHLYEVWGWRHGSGNRLYDAMVIDLPKGMPIGVACEEKAKVAGYFFKLQGYEPGSAKPNARPLVAPLLIGRIHWEPRVVPAVSASDWTWGLVAVAVLIVVAAVLGFAAMRRDRHVALAPLAMSRNPETPSLEEWLDEQGAAEDSPGNKLSETGESKDGEADRDDVGDDGPPSSPGDFGAIQR